jgi:pimeloyl-ACP methyl ester carboxylesterase
VPIDYQKPNGGSVQIAISRLKATDSAKRRGVLLLNPGGPGEPGINLPLLVASAGELGVKLLEHFDLIGFDPRGTGSSEAILCESAGYPEALYLDITGAKLAANREKAEKVARDYARSCAAVGSFITQVGTNNVARDMDRLREALNEPTISYMGFSYGTWIGAAYARLYPERVRAMYLDGVMLPEADFERLGAESAASLEAALVRLNLACKRDQKCPLSDTDLTAVYDAILARLSEKPLTVAGAESAIDWLTIRNYLLGALHNPSRLGNAPWILQQVQHAIENGTQLPREILAEFGDASQGYGGQIISDDPYYAIHCADMGSRRSAASIIDDALANVHVTPHYWHAYLIELPCTALPPSNDHLEVAFTSAASNMLLVGTDGDPATPYAWSERMSKALGGTHLLRYQGDGHTALFTSACVATRGLEFLIDQKAESGTCEAEPISFARAEQSEKRLASFERRLPNTGALPAAQQEVSFPWLRPALSR